MRYHDITKADMRNGDGLRVVLWTAGCEIHCPLCQNPVTWDPDDGLEFTNTELNEIMSELDKEWCSGITYSGGNPLHPNNIDDITYMAEFFRRMYPGKTQWLYTGKYWDEIKHLPVMKFLDVVVDGPFEHTLKSNKLAWKGSANQRTIDVQESLRAGKLVLWCDDFGHRPGDKDFCGGEE